ncbi:putative replicase [Johnsongrass umbra-like virus 1]|nr:putative replicase [Johnsongrass umbra-like virus 1]
MENRVLRYKGQTPIAPTREAYDHLLRAVNTRYSSRPDKVYPLSLEGFLNCYTGRRRTRYEQAVSDLRLAPLTREDARVSTFIKNEKFNYLAKRDGTDPRAIQPRKPKYLAAVGTWFKPLEHIMYQDLAQRLYGDEALPCIAKGLNAQQTGFVLRQKWDRFTDPVCVSLDASRFDLHVSVDALKFTHKLYHKYCQSRELQKYLRWTLSNSGVASCSETAYKYEVQGRRMSGDMDTALGNCILMVCLTWHMLTTMNVRHELLDNGDDCLFICNAADVPTDEQITDFYRQFGFVVKLEGRTSMFERIEFCQTQPVLTATGWRMIRQLPSIAKDLTNVNMAQKSQSEYTAWLKAVGLCGRTLNDGVPIFHAFHNMLVRLGTDSRIHRSVFYECGLVNLVKGMRYEQQPVTHESRLSFHRAFGVDPAMQLAVEEYYGSVQGPLGKSILHEWPIQLKEEYDSGAEWFVLGGGPRESLQGGEPLGSLSQQ